MATLRISLFEPPSTELEPLLKNPPRWAVRVYESYGGTASEFPVSAAIEALGESLGRRLRGIALVIRQAESRGWIVRLEGDSILIVNGLAAGPTRDMLEEDGVWDLVSRYFDAEGSAVSA